MLASQIGNIDIINLFLAKGANINVTNVIEIIINK